MVKYTTGELIKILKKFPDNTPITNNLALIWDFPDEIRNTKEFTENPIITSQNKATRLGLFEGDWKQENMVEKAEEFKESV